LDLNCVHFSALQFSARAAIPFWNNKPSIGDWTFHRAAADCNHEEVSEEVTWVIPTNPREKDPNKVSSAHLHGGTKMIRRASDRARSLPHTNPLEPQRKPVAADGFAPEPLLDTDQAAAIMRIHPKTLQRYARQGIVRGFQLGTMWRFRATDLDRWISERLAG
jgi:excisionase family DNA binding protein